MGVERFWVRGYRSLVDLELPLGPLTVVRGGNAVGKTSLYRALLLLARGADGRLAETVLAEGGMPSMRWAGPARARTGRRDPPTRITFGAEVDGVSYELNLGFPVPGPGRSAEAPTVFALDAQIKEEQAWIGARSRHTMLLDRSGDAALAMDPDQQLVALPLVFDRAEPALSQLGEPARFPELFALRARLARWRFYHHLPSGPDAPARHERPGVRTPVLADDGADVAAALATIAEIGRWADVEDAVGEALGGAVLDLRAEGGTFGLGLRLPGLRRPLTGPELSDGTVRFLCLVAALLSPRPPELLVLNEPETSLHPEVLPALAGLIGIAASETQVLVTTHAPELADALAADHGAALATLERGPDGATSVEVV